MYCMLMKTFRRKKSSEEILHHLVQMQRDEHFDVRECSHTSHHEIAKYEGLVVEGL